jgi:large subunit ribosomal protein L15
MKLHDLRPADGSRRPRTRVGRGIAAGKGKTAGRGTKGQKARAGGSIAPWFEGGQTPLHVRIPKLRGFRNPFKVQYEVVNIGRIADLVAAGRLGSVETGSKKGKAAPITVNQEILRATGLVSTLDKPLKILGHGEIDVALFVVADAFTRSAVEKIERAGGSVQVLETPTGPMQAIGVEVDDRTGETTPASDEPQADPAGVPPAEEAAKGKPAARPRRARAKATEPGETTEAPASEPTGDDPEGSAPAAD